MKNQFCYSCHFTGFQSPTAVRMIDKRNKCFDFKFSFPLFQNFVSFFPMAYSSIIFACLLFGPALISAQYAAPPGSVECPGIGLYTAAHPTDCDKYYLCRNGTLTLEHCPNGLLYAVEGAVYEFCAHNWKVDCQGRKAPGPIPSPGCPWQFGIFEDGTGKCAVTYAECAWGVPHRKYCEPKGLVYDERIKGCNWPDEVGCASENIIGFKCPEEDKSNKFYPYSRYYYSSDAIVTCVNNQPRLIHCEKDHYADQYSMTCLPYEKDEKEGY